VIKKILGLMLISTFITIFAMDEGPTATTSTPPIRPRDLTGANLRLFNAVNDNNFNEAKKALGDGADPNIAILDITITPLVIALIKSPTIAKLIIEKIQPSSNLRLAYGAKIGDLEMIKRALKDGADINNTEFNQWTALGLAIAEGNENIVKFLLEQPKINVNKQSDWAGTPLMIAAQFLHDDTAVIDILLNDPRTNINEKLIESDEPTTAFEIAIRQQNWPAALAIATNPRWKKPVNMKKNLDNLLYSIDTAAESQSFIQLNQLQDLLSYLINQLESQKNTILSQLIDSINYWENNRNVYPADYWEETIAPLISIYLKIIPTLINYETPAYIQLNQGDERTINILDFLIKHGKISLIGKILPY
jgi:Ankyrin repeats (3 copies)